MRSERSTPLVLLGALLSVGVYAVADLLAEHTMADAMLPAPATATAVQPQDLPDASVMIPMPVALPTSHPAFKFVIDLK